MPLFVELRKKSILVACVLAFFIQSAISILAISKSPSTPFDEFTHFDYVVKLSKGHLPSTNEKYGQSALKFIFCNGDIPYDQSLPIDCTGNKIDPSFAPFQGQSSATGYPPHYYLLTAIPFEVCDRTGQFAEITCARYANSIWLALSASASASLMILFGSGLLLALSISIGYASLSSVLLQGVTVNSDAAVQFFAPLLVILAWQIAKHFDSLKRISVIWFLVLFLVIPFKQTLIPIAMISTLFLWHWVSTNSKVVRFKSFGLLSLAFLSSVIAIFVMQKLQVPWRGIGGGDFMGPFLKQEWSTVPNFLISALNFSLTPFGDLRWEPISGYAFIVSGILISLLGWISWFAGPTDSEMKPGAVLHSPFIDSSIRTISFVLVPLIPVLMSLALWFAYGTTPVNARYYMATAITLGCIGVASTSNKSLKLLFSTVMASSTIFMIYTLLTI
jgi:hypothetical protein